MFCGVITVSTVELLGHPYLWSLPIHVHLCSLVPRPKLSCVEEGLTTFECFLDYVHRYVIIFQMALHNAYGRLQPMLLGYKHQYLQSDWLARKQDCWLSTTKKKLNCHQTPFLVRGSGLGTRLTFVYSVMRTILLHLIYSLQCVD